MRRFLKAALTITGLLLMIGSGKAYGHASRVPCAHQVSYRRFASEARTDYHGHERVRAAVRPRLLSMRGCSRPSVRRAETRLWVRQIRAHNRRRRAWLLIQRYEPYMPGHWAIPEPIVMCESSGSATANNGNDGGYYQILFTGYGAGTWGAYGGLRFAPTPMQASKLDQSIVASRIWDHGRGAGQWQCAGMVAWRLLRRAGWNNG